MSKNHFLEVSDSMKAWEIINRAFLREDTFSFVNNKIALYAYDVVLKIKNPKIDPDFDFGRNFNYSKMKWVKLIGNYVSIEELKALKEEIFILRNKRNSRGVYNVALKFKSKYTDSKSCLLSMVCSNRMGESKPTIVVFLRASEVTKRLICDLLLFQRIGEYLYDKQPFTLVIHFNQLFNDNSVLLMYNVHESIPDILRDIETERSNSLLFNLNKLLQVNPMDIKYKVHRRVAKVLHPEICKYPVTLVRDCKLNI